jgi:hypothetical protein
MQGRFNVKVQKAWAAGVINLKNIFRIGLFLLFYANLSEFGVYLCNFKGRGTSKQILDFSFLFNVNLSDHSKGKRHAIPIYSLIYYEFPI